MLSMELVALLPAAVSADSVSHYVEVMEVPGGGLGETVLLLSGSRLLVFWRRTSLDAYQLLELSQKDALELQLQPQTYGATLPLPTATGRQPLAINGSNVEAVTTLLHALAQSTAQSNTGEDVTSAFDPVAPAESTATAEPLRSAHDYKQHLKQHPDDLDASRALEALYRAKHKWSKLVDLLMDRVEYLDEVEEQVVTLVEAARVCSAELDEFDTAFEVLRVVLSLEPCSPLVSEALEHLAVATDGFNELLALYVESIQDADDADTRCWLWVRVGCLYRDRLERPEYALAAFQQALEQQPDDTAAREASEALERLLGSA